jgi:glycosyltransferase involved in cell wall biosynthesis
MTSYNREKYIAEAILSVQASSYRNWELIVVDDCSKDNTLEIARSFERNDSRIKVYLNERNLGDYPNRNKAASYAAGEYIKYVDADDLIYPWGLEIVVRCMTQFPEAGYGLDSIEQDMARPFPFMLNPGEAYRRHYFKAPTFHKAPSSCMIKTDVFRSAGGFSGKWMIGDFELWLKLSQKYNVLLMPMGIVWSRQHEEQESRHIREDSKVVFGYSVTEMELLKAAECPLEPSEKELVIRRIVRSQARSALRSLVVERNRDSFLKKLELANLSPLACIKWSLTNVR